MSKSFEFLPPPSSVQEQIEYLQREIAKAMTIPEHLLRPETYNEAYARRYRETEIMRQELTRLVIEQWPLAAVIKENPNDR